MNCYGGEGTTSLEITVNCGELCGIAHQLAFIKHYRPQIQLAPIRVFLQQAYISGLHFDDFLNCIQFHQNIFFFKFIPDLTHIDLQIYLVFRKDRLLTFHSNENGMKFNTKVGNQICLRQYIEAKHSKEAILNKEIIHFFANPYSQYLILRNTSIGSTLMKGVANAIGLHQKLLEIKLVHCDISDEDLAEINHGMEQGNNVTLLDLSDNKITSKSAKHLKEIVQSAKNRKLMSLSLDNNCIMDCSVQEIAQGLLDKYIYLTEEKSKTNISPIEFLSLENTKIGDKGVISLVHTLENIATRNRQSNEDFENTFSLNISKNDITNNGITMISQILTKFNAIYSLGLSGLERCKTSGFLELIRALKINQSLQLLDISRNSLQNTILSELYTVLRENYIICRIKLSLGPAIGPILCNPPALLRHIYVLDLDSLH